MWRDRRVLLTIPLLVVVLTLLRARLNGPVRRHVDPVPLGILDEDLDRAAVADTVAVSRAERFEQRAARLDLLQGHLDAEVPAHGIVLEEGLGQQRQVELAVR